MSSAGSHETGTTTTAPAATGAESLEHVMEHVLGMKEDSIVARALRQDEIDDIEGLLTLSETDIESLYVEETRKVNNKDKTVNIAIPRGHRAKILLFKQYLAWREEQGNPVGRNFISITRQAFDDFRLQHAKLTTQADDASVSNASTSAAAPTGHNPVMHKASLVDSFKKGIKRDQDKFPTLKDERYQDNWHRTFEVQCRAQDLEELLTINSAPNDPDMRAVFDLKQKFLYAVLHEKVQTTRGRAIVRKHAAKYDAQAAYQDLLDHHRGSIAADLSAEEIETYLTTTKIGDGKFRGNTNAFITHFVNQMDLHETLTGSPYRDEEKLRFLSRAVKGVQALRNVYDNAKLLAATSGMTRINWDTYLELILAASTNHDSVMAVKPKRAVYQHEWADHCEDNHYSVNMHHSEWQDDGEAYDIDTPVSVIEANMTNRRQLPPKRMVHMPKERWLALDNDSKSIWDKLSDKAKATILGYSDNHDASPHNNNSSTNPSRRVNMHDVADSHTEEDIFQDAEQPPEDSSETREVNQSDTKPRPHLPPHDVRRMMSQPTNNKAKSKLMAKMAQVTYRISKHTVTSKKSLVDRGANGGVSGSDVRVLDQHLPHREVDIEGVQSHRITSIKICTVAGVIDTDKGPVVAIMHQYAHIGEGHTIHSSAQLEAFGHDVNDKSIRVPGGKQRIQTADGYLIPLIIENGLPRMKMRPPTDTELRDLPQTILTRPEGDTMWDPTILDFDPTEQDPQWFDTLEHLEQHPHANLFDEYGNYRRRVTAQLTSILSRSHGNDPDSDNLDAAILQAHQDLEQDTDQWSDYYPSDTESLPSLLQGCPSDSDSEPDYDIPNWDDIPPDGDQDYGENPPLDAAPAMAIPPLEAHQTQQIATEPPQDLPEPEPPPTPSRSPRTVTHKDPDYSSLRRFFGWLSADTVKQTFQHTTQLGRLTVGTLLKRAYKSPNPILNVLPRGEPVASDRIISDTPAVDCGVTEAQIFVGLRTSVTDAYPIHTPKQFVNTLEDNVRERGRMTKLITDRDQTEIHGRALEYQRVMGISSWQSEPHSQWQNPAERCIQHVKDLSNRILDRTGAPPEMWLLCLMYVCYILNHTWNDTIKNVPLTALLGHTVDVSALLRFHFWEPVYYKAVEPGFPSDSKEELGYIVGISEHVGNALCYKVFNPITRKVIHRSRCRSLSPDDPNFRAASAGGENSTASRNLLKIPRHETTESDTTHGAHPDQTTENGEPLDDRQDSDDETNKTSIAISKPEDLIGRSFLLEPDEHGNRFRARVVEMIEDFDNELENNGERTKFLCVLNDNEREELISYNKVLERLEQDNDGVLWKYKRIVSHQGPLKKGDKDYEGSRYNVMVEWETGEVSPIPLGVLAKTDPVTAAIYAKKNGLLSTPGWKQFRSIAKNDKKFLRMAKQAYLRSFRTAPKYKYGIEIPRNYEDAMRLDRLNGNTKWSDATKLELKQIDDYESFLDLGHKSRVRPPEGYKRIRVHLVFDCKHDGRHKARLVADGHLTDAPLESVYSGVVTLRGFRMVMFLAELNGLEFWATDIGNAYLESKTSEKVYIIAGEEFGDRQGHVLVIKKALYGLRSSGKRWHDRLFDCLIQLGFEPCKAEPDIWIRRNGDVYEYVAVYVDDLALALKNPQEFLDQLTSHPYNFKLKGSGPITFHLGMDFSRDQYGILTMAPKKYIEKMVANYERLFGEPPKTNVYAPIEKGDHPEMDTTELLGEEQIKVYQSLIGGLQWIVTIGRFDIMTAVMTLSSFRAAPRKGHLERAKRIYGYLSKMRNAAIRVRTDEPDYSDIPVQEIDWSRTVHGKIEEIIPDNAPEPLGKHVTLTHYVDANLMHDLITGRSVTGILHFLNKTPVEWYSKKQSTVEVATYSSEMLAMRSCVEQIIDLRNTLRYLGVPIREKSYVFGDNESVVKSVTKVEAKLHKRHNMLSFHFVREAIARGFIHFTHIPGKENPADIMSKHWGYSDVWPLLKAMLFWEGDTLDID